MDNEKEREEELQKDGDELNEEVQEEINEEAAEEEKDESEDIVSELQEKVNGLQESLLRKAAEFENYKRRTENDQLNLIKYAAESFILKVLPVYDDLKRSVNHLDESNIDSLKEGLKLVLSKFDKTLEEQGVQKIESVGKEFDVEYHEALLQQPSNEIPENNIIEEIDAGYVYKDKVIRHAKVIVSKGSEDSTNENE